MRRRRRREFLKLTLHGQQLFLELPRERKQLLDGQSLRGIERHARQMLEPALGEKVAAVGVVVTHDAADLVANQGSLTN